MRNFDAGQPKGATVLPPPEGFDPDQYVDLVKRLQRTGMPWFNASQIARAQLLGARNDDGARLLLKPHKPLNFQPMRGAELEDKEHTPEKVERRLNRLVSKREGPLDPDGEVIHDSRIRRAAEEHGEKFWALAETKATAGISKTLARHLAAQELGVPALDAA